LLKTVLTLFQAHLRCGIKYFTLGSGRSVTNEQTKRSIIYFSILLHDILNSLCMFIPSVMLTTILFLSFTHLIHNMFRPTWPFSGVWNCQNCPISGFHFRGNVCYACSVLETCVNDCLAKWTIPCLALLFRF
jgi:hypothetical protein